MSSMFMFTNYILFIVLENYISIKKINFKDLNFVYRVDKKTLYKWLVDGNFNLWIYFKSLYSIEINYFLLNVYNTL